MGVQKSGKHMSLNGRALVMLGKEVFVDSKNKFS